MEEIENSKQWKVNIVEDEKFPFIVIDNWYSENEELAVWKELDYYFCNQTFKFVKKLKFETFRKQKAIQNKENYGTSTETQ